MTTSTRPSARRGPTMAYDSNSDRVILFGGYVESTGTYQNDTWAYNFNTNTWTDMNPATRPAGRDGHAMTYDAESDRVILFGGNKGDLIGSDETWAFDFNNNTWTNVNPGTRPAGRWIHAMAYDSESDRVILFGGAVGVKPYPSNDVWAYDFNTNTWTNMNRVTRPASRWGHAMAYDAESDRVILFGSHSLGFDHETWVYDFNNNTWTNMDPATGPPGRSGHFMAYNDESDRVVLFGGIMGFLGNAERNDETWTYDVNWNSWIRANPAESPSPRHLHAMAYDSESDRIILFGGSTGGDQTWSHRYSPPPPAAPPAPPPVPPWVYIAGGVAGAAAVAAAAALLIRRSRGKRRGKE